ncbi:hypothetical protein K466DRAFT_600924 [Polyporus arcularius HHB13444]|uniref:Ribonuclease H1 N-terminal domain-containing protein n=1 Tax=Polyporus arcularius HHB13444 TaxID=1314778 RepID=A0A5C3P7S0_9APHY|nr:hypothetical protein K466DRAFT_600924 [Polyporus arcularius HHB13444]
MASPRPVSSPQLSIFSSGLLGSFALSNTALLAMPLTQAQHDRRNRAARAIGATPAYEEDGTLVVFGDRDDDDSYTVWEGRCRGVFMGWGLTHAMVDGYPGAAFKRFDSIEDARKAFINGPPWEENWQVPDPCAPMVTAPAVSRRTPSSSRLATRSTSTSATYVSAQGTPSAPQIAAQPPAADSGSKNINCPSSPLPTPPSASHGQVRTGSRVVAYNQPTFVPLPTPQTQARIPLRPSAVPTDDVRSKTGTMLLPSSTPRTSTSSIPTTSTSSIMVEDGRTYVVVRGDYPGVYIDKLTAFAKAGKHPGVMVRACPSYAQAEKYYARAEARGEVGVPVFKHELPQ